MDGVVIALLIIIGVVLLLLIFGNKINIQQQTTKSPKVKKDEIYAAYKKELEEILNRYKDNKDEQLKQKKLFLQKVTSELSRNIYFSPEENKQIIQKLVSI